MGIVGDTLPSFFHDSHPFSHSNRGTWVEVHREGIVTAVIFTLVYSPLLQHQVPPFRWGGCYIQGQKPTWQRSEVTTYFLSVHCFWSTVNEPHGKCERWQNNIILSTTKCCCNQHLMILTISFRGLKVSTIHWLCSYESGWINMCLNIKLTIQYPVIWYEGGSCVTTAARPRFENAFLGGFWPFLSCNLCFTCKILPWKRYINMCVNYDNDSAEMYDEPQFTHNKWFHINRFRNYECIHFMQMHTRARHHEFPEIHWNYEPVEIFESFCCHTVSSASAGISYQHFWTL